MSHTNEGARAPPLKKQCVSSNGGEAEGEEAPAVVLVTGGKGLVGKALEEAVTSDPRPKEKWIFLSTADGDLW